MVINKKRGISQQASYPSVGITVFWIALSRKRCLKIGEVHKILGSREQQVIDFPRGLEYN